LESQTCKEFFGLEK
jgi:hypothetical protein